MRKYKNKECYVCGNLFKPTGNCAKYCSEKCKATVWTREILSKRTYDWQVKKGVIKNPGVGTGKAQGFGSSHHSFRKDALHRYRDYLKTMCERCGSTKYLCGHHKDRNRLNNLQENIETLCKSCHQTEHECYKNFMVGFDHKRREKLRKNMIYQNRNLPRENGKNKKEK